MEENNVLSFEELWSQYKIFFSEVFAKNSLRWSAVFGVEKPQVSDIKQVGFWQARFILKHFQVVLLLEMLKKKEQNYFIFFSFFNLFILIGS